ncbi:TF26 protein, partial [Syrrhaptes paradoxus]|nr:TF26 protein [Syrrhaptes paradoxus]
LLMTFERPNSVKLVQYVDDILITGESKEEVRKATISLLNFLGMQGLKVSKNKLQFTEQEVKYLGHWLIRGTKKLDPKRVSGILSLPQPRNKKEIRQLL